MSSKVNPSDQLIQLMNEASIWQGNIKLNRNEVLVEAGQKEDRLFYVESGSIRVTLDSGAEEHTIRLGYSGNIIAALDSFITGGPTQFSIQALKQTELRFVKKEVYMNWIQVDASRKELWDWVNSMLILQQMEREVDILTENPAERLKRVLARSPKLFQEVPHKYIAMYLRMSPETLSRIKKS